MILLSWLGICENGMVLSIFLSVYFVWILFHFVLHLKKACRVIAWIFLSAYLFSEDSESNKLCSKPLSQWPTYSALIKKIIEDKVINYPNQELKKFLEANCDYETNSPIIAQRWQSTLEWSGMGLICDIIFILGTQGWQKLLDDEHGHWTPGRWCRNHIGESTGCHRQTGGAF